MREAKLEDIKGILLLAMESFIEQDALYRAGSMPTSEPVQPLDTSKLIRNLRSSILSKDSIIFITESSDMITGVLWVSKVPAGVYSSHIITIDLFFYIRKKYRGSRSFVSLIEGYETWCKENKIRHCLLGINSGINPDKSKALFKKLGYKECGVQLVKEL